MSTKTLLNILQLAYSPISNYDFAVIKDDKLIKGYMNKASIYAIVQRPVLTFQNLDVDKTNPIDPFLTFEIHQQGNKEILTGRLRIYQRNFGADKDQGIYIAVTHTYPKPNDEEPSFPFFNVANFIFKTAKQDVIWLSPEKLIYHYLRDTIEVDIFGNIPTLLKYQVYYVGKSTEQDIVERLTGHSHLQDILSLERPLHYGTLPTDEIAILFFEFQENFNIASVGEEDGEEEMQEMVDLIMGRTSIDDKAIYLDAEKALINVLKPKHNRQLYNNYPKSADGLYKHNLNLLTYSLYDPLTLMYSDGEISGDPNYLGADRIVIENGSNLYIEKFKK
ncbi:hypothetical protein [Pedobacter soli]|uniref:Uncharacterized protein n=1 Tax=Pedobacter soli TaxID=390242 RepID=A0A1G6WQV8_9SPHI|nr:hypothetical protein [Pedobacter soli]SDD67486.1 hypothetical protein SAMN04488024_10776 [Pedobacter soli]